ncbi:hypothetical protein AB1Y20_020534 [Prymnesium parvum]|uniref:G-protein coupled receptors family 2 profile 2 domain-containing protein n=1 Tax=Prymnesium parvum TaxID=97485 RepID=A0AB34JYC7_PRYPA
MDIRSNDGCVDALIENATLTNSSSTGALIIGFDSEALDTLKTAAICSAFLSICGSSFVIMTYHLMRVHKPLVLSLLYWLSVTDLISSLVYIIDGLSANADLMSCEPFTFCVFKAMLHQTFNLAAMLWTGSIALNLHLGLVLQAKIARQPAKFLRRLHICIWSFAPSVSLLLLLNGSYGRAGWCWIREHKAWQRFVCYYFPMLLVLGYNAVVYFLTQKTLLAMKTAANNSSESSIELTSSHAVQGLARRMRLLLVIFVLVHTCSIINRLYDFFSPDQPSFFFSLLQSLSAPLQGLGNAIVYGFGSSRVRQTWGCNSDRCSCCDFFSWRRKAKNNVPSEVAAATVLSEFESPTDSRRESIDPG